MFPFLTVGYEAHSRAAFVVRAKNTAARGRSSRRPNAVSGWKGTANRPRTASFFEKLPRSGCLIGSVSLRIVGLRTRRVGPSPDAFAPHPIRSQVSRLVTASSVRPLVIVIVIVRASNFELRISRLQPFGPRRRRLLPLLLAARRHSPRSTASLRLRPPMCSPSDANLRLLAPSRSAPPPRSLVLTRQPNYGPRAYLWCMDNFP